MESPVTPFRNGGLCWRPIPGFLGRGISVVVAILAMGFVDCAGAQPHDEDKVSSRDVPGSKLLTPSSFGFSIPVGEPEPSPFAALRVRVEGQDAIAKVHCKVGDNFIVMLPDGQLVGVMADAVEPTEESFEPARNRIIAAELNRELARFRGMKIKTTKHYIFAYNTSEGFADATRNILESMLDGVEKYMDGIGLQTSEPMVPLIVIMFRKDAEFQAYRNFPPGVLAYYDMVSNRVILKEESPLVNTRPDLVRGQLLSTIAHEGAHQILHNIGVQQRLSMWPMWLTEGLAEYLAPTSFGRSNRWKGAGVVNDLRMFDLETYLQSQVITGFNGDTITGAVAAARLDSTGYATAWSIVHYLAHCHEDEFEALVRRYTHLGPLRGMAARAGQPVVENLEHFAESFGNDFEQLEKDMVEYLTQLEFNSPVANSEHFVGLIELPGSNGERKRHACFFNTEEKILEWRQRIQAAYSQEELDAAQWKIEQFPNRKLANDRIRRFLR